MNQYLTEEQVRDWIEFARAGGQLPADIQEQIMAMALLYAQTHRRRNDNPD